MKGGAKEGVEGMGHRQGIDQAEMEWKKRSENETKKRGNETC